MSFDGGGAFATGDAFDDAFRLAVDHISTATLGAEERVANSGAGKSAHQSTAHSSDANPGQEDYGVFESTCAVLHACWPRALPSFARAYAFKRGVSAKDVAAIAFVNSRRPNWSSRIRRAGCRASLARACCTSRGTRGSRRGCS